MALTAEQKQKLDAHAEAVKQRLQAADIQAKLNGSDQVWITIANCNSKTAADYLCDKIDAPQGCSITVYHAKNRGKYVVRLTNKVSSSKTRLSATFDF